MSTTKNDIDALYAELMAATGLRKADASPALYAQCADSIMTLRMVKAVDDLIDMRHRLDRLEQGVARDNELMARRAAHFGKAT